MSDFLERKNRDVIPQWRSFEDTLAADPREITSSTRVRQAPRPLADQPYFDSLRAYRRRPSAWYAADLLAAAIAKNESAVAAQAAQTLVDDPKASPASRSLAQSYLGIKAPIVTDESGERKKIALARHSISLHPHDAIAWTDLSRGLLIDGRFDAARRAMIVALQLAPLNRFVLRAASRFYAQIGDFDTALNILRRSDLTVHDPWLVASEIALARSAGARPKLVRQGRELLKGDFAAKHISELASALGTLEYFESMSRSKTNAFRLLDLSLHDPNDNSLAQAAWFKFAKNAKTKDIAGVHVQRDFEAQTRRALHEGDFQQLIPYAQEWFDDQPFSERAAEMLSWFATELSVSEVERAIDILERAIRTNPESPGLWNNLAFSRALAGDTVNAESALHRADRAGDTDSGDEVARTATRGMLLFRSQQPDRGRLLYERAIEIATERRLDKRLLLSAFTNLAREEALAGTKHALPTMIRAIEHAGQIDEKTADVQRQVVVMLTQIAKAPLLPDGESNEAIETARAVLERTPAAQRLSPG